ncbi:hypothetical protein RvY_13937 [Ramazzottius varieornatus]|uniref:NADH dehydrogenase [ubiquinone] 1 alpha subcomplex subunit 9, mitochondrial n=1 Tax=Ramazzottius varieornatus TaxID=947166 RepID=A0A1D1VPP5_RAMVA|nr:hypothetical protein RvY_13937 [Ramazzottius varieornatus]
MHSTGGLVKLRTLCDSRITSQQCATATRLFIREKHDSHLGNAANRHVEGPDHVPQVPTSAKSSILGNMKRGRGGRSSFSGIVATVFGASQRALVAPVLINALGKIGSQIIVAHRCDPYDVKDFKLMGDLGQILFHQVDLRDEAAIRKSMKYSNVVINLIGRDYETKNFSFEQVHVEGARRLARIARETGVGTFIHLSALNAAEKPKRCILPGGSKFLASKWRGENAVREEFPDAIIMRPADIFGPEDRFFNYYARPWRKNATYMPLWKSGEQTIKQPVYVGDVCEGIVKSISDKDAPGRTYDLVGPRRYYLSDLVDWMHLVMRRNPEFWGYIRGPLDPITAFKIFCSTFFAYNTPRMTMERTEREYVTDVRTPGNLDLEDLGLTSLKNLEDYAPWHLKPYRAFNYYTEELGEFPDPGFPYSMPGDKKSAFDDDYLPALPKDWLPRIIY